MKITSKVTINKKDFCNMIRRSGMTATSMYYNMPISTVYYYKKTFKVKTKGTRKNELHNVYKMV